MNQTVLLRATNFNYSNTYCQLVKVVGKTEVFHYNCRITC